MKELNQFIIAHRGESIDAPENTLAAINLAWDRGAKSVEIDVQLTKDNEIVVLHDKDTLRISGKKYIISKTSLRELKQLNAGLYKGEKWKNERIPTLREVIKTVPKEGKLIIEIKSNESILEKLKSELVYSTLKDDQIEIIAFNIDTLTKAKQIMPAYKMLWLLNLDYQYPWWLVILNKKKMIRKIETRNLNGVDVWAGKRLTKCFISKMKDAGLLIYTWTVNDAKKAKILLDNGIEGITTDRSFGLSGELKTMYHQNLLDKNG